jgi:hypothetical protein
MTTGVAACSCLPRRVRLARRSGPSRVFKAGDGPARAGAAQGQRRLATTMRDSECLVVHAHCGQQNEIRSARLSCVV